MARKKQETQLLRDLESQEDWDEVMSKEGLWVVDVYQDWAGPCNAMVSNFRRIKNELGDDLLQFAMAKADTIDALDKYRGSCEPCFLFFAGGKLVAFVHGANSPLILRTITEQLAQEHKILEGNIERKEVKDPFVSKKEETEEASDEEEEEEEEEEGFTVALIKPNAVRDGKVDEILEELRAHNIKILVDEERLLKEDEARNFYSHLKDEEYFEDMIKFMTSGPSHVLVLSKGEPDDSIIFDWRDLLGPPSVEEAREKAPDSLRAKYGTEGYMNALHGSDSKDAAARELAFFFPNKNIHEISQKPSGIQRTLALIRPEAFVRNKEEILAKIKEAGFQIAMRKEVQLTKQQAEEFYKEHVGKPYFEKLTSVMSRGPLLALGLARQDAVEKWRDMLGPTKVEEAKSSAPGSLRAQFSYDAEELNQIHGSDTPQSAQKELQFFFPVEQTVAVIKPDAIGTKDAIIQKIHEAGFRIAAQTETKITREIAESIYADQKDKEYFNNLVEYVSSGPTMFMVLSREDAVEGWRQEIGPTDPLEAKTVAPDSIRAKFGQDLLRNAVHGASSKDKALREIEAVFGNIEFNPDGSVKGEPVKQKTPKQKQKEDKDLPSLEVTQEENVQEEPQTDSEQPATEGEQSEPQAAEESKTEPSGDTAGQEQSEAGETSEGAKAEEEGGTKQEETTPEVNTNENAENKPDVTHPEEPKQEAAATEEKQEEINTSSNAEEAKEEKANTEDKQEQENTNDNAEETKQEATKTEEPKDSQTEQKSEETKEESKETEEKSEAPKEKSEEMEEKSEETKAEPAAE